MPSRKTNRALKRMFTTLEMMETTIGVREFCMPMNQPWMAKREMEAGAAQMRAKKYSAASACAPSLPQRESPQGIAQHDEQQGQYHGYGHRADQDAGALPQVAGAVGLCRDAARPHAQEAAGPVDHVEDRRPDTDGAYRGGTVVQSACDGRIDHSQQRNGDVGDDVRYGEPQDLPVHPVHNSSHACSYACKGIFFPWDTPIPPSEKRPATAALRVW